MPPRKILIVSGFSIFPEVTGGQLRTGGIARALARLGYEVRLYVLAGRREHYRRGKPAFLIEDIEPGLVQEIHLGWGLGLLQSLFRRLEYPRVWQYEVMRRGWIPERLARALAEAHVVLCNSPDCPRVPGAWNEKPWLLISHNLEHVLFEQGSRAERAYARSMRRREEAAATEYSDILACAESDRDFFRAHDAAGRQRIPIVQIGVDPRRYRAPEEVRERVREQLGVTPDERLVIFSGSRFGPNLDALAQLRAFCDEQADWLAQRRVRLLVAGSMEPQPSRGRGLITTGRVDDMVPYFAAADAGLNPVQRGSGANVKLFEYLAAGLPVISTRFGVRGSELKPGLDYIDYDPLQPKRALEVLLGHDREHWRRYTDAVWDRHRANVDIVEIVRKALAELPAFAGGPPIKA